MCYTGEDICDTVGKVKKRCDNAWIAFGKSGVLTYKCSLADDKKTKLYVEDKAAYETCDVICAPSDEPGQDACIENELVEGGCSTYNQIVCTSSLGHAGGCALIDGKQACHEGKCTTVNEISDERCEGSGWYSVASYNKCVEADDGSLVIVRTSRECMNGCNAAGTACR